MNIFFALTYPSGGVWGTTWREKPHLSPLSTLDGLATHVEQLSNLMEQRYVSSDMMMIMKYDGKLSVLLTNTFDFQFYIITGGLFANGSLASTEILKKEGGTSWQTAASLPSARKALKGITLPNGKFLVTGDGL